MAKQSIFQVWWYSQAKSIGAIDPSQPSDPSKNMRMYVVVAPSNFSTKVTCCPIQNNDSGRIGLTEVELPTNIERFITKKSKILCHEIYTMPEKFFQSQAGTITDKRIQEKIRLALKSYLRL